MSIDGSILTLSDGWAVAFILLVVIAVLAAWHWLVVKPFFDRLGRTAIGLLAVRHARKVLDIIESADDDVETPGLFELLDELMEKIPDWWHTRHPELKERCEALEKS